MEKERKKRKIDGDAALPDSGSKCCYGEIDELEQFRDVLKSGKGDEQKVSNQYVVF